MKNFVFRSEWAQAAESLPEQVRAEFYAAVIRYGTTGKTSALKAQAAVAFAFVRAQIDADEERRAEISRKRSEAGAKHTGNQYAQPEPKPKKELKEPKETKKEIPPTKFNEWLKDHCPYIYANLKLPTEEQVEKLKQMYGAQLIADTCMQIENRKDKRKTYVNLYLTLRNWLKREGAPVEQVVRQYNVADAQFLQDYPPELQQGIERKRRDAILGDYPTLKETDNGTARVWLILQLQDLAESCGVKADAKPLEQLADVMLTNWGTFKVTEFLLFFYRVKSGRYERFYGRFDPLKVTASFQIFLRELNEFYAQINN